MDSLHDVLHSDFGTNIFQYLSIHCIYSSFISVSSSSRKYFEKMSNLSLLKQLICYDFPLIFLIDTTLNDRLKRHQLSSSLNVNSLISIIYTNISALSISRTLYDPYLTLYGSYENILDINFSKNLTMAMRCGGILGIRHYIKRISKIKNIPIKNLYRVRQLIPIGPNIELKVLRWKYLIPEIAKAIVKASNGNRRPYHITDIWMYNAFEVYLNHFAKDGMMIDQGQKVYLEQFQRFMVNHIRVDIDLTQKVIQKYEAILYRNCHNAIKPGSNIYQLT
eukprot:452804_1